MMFPKDPPVIDRALLVRIKQVIGRCEWPGPRPCGSNRWLEAAHIRAKGMGGGRRKDTPENIIILCPHHHALYDNKLGQSRQMQEILRSHIQESRTPEEWERINETV